MKTVFLVALSVFSLASHAGVDSVPDLLNSLKKFERPFSNFYSEKDNTTWLNDLSIHPNVYSEFKKYKSNGQELPQNYINEVIGKSRKETLNRQKLWLQNPGCELKAKSEILDASPFIARPAYSSNEIDLISDFESSFIRIEATGCVSTDSALKVFNEYISIDFQKAAISEIKHSEIKKDGICDTTEVFGIGKSKYCSDMFVNYDEASNLVTLHTYNVSNAPLKEANAPVYFREILASFKKVGPKLVAVNFIAHVRGGNVPTLVRSVARSKIESTQTKLFNLLNQRVSK